MVGNVDGTTKSTILRQKTLFPETSNTSTPEVSGDSQKQIAELQAERDALRQKEALRTRVQESSHGFINADMVTKLVEHQVETRNGRLLAKDGRTVEAILTDFAEKSPYTTRRFHEERGSLAQRPAASTGPSDSELAKLFGKGSNASSANKLALADPERYRAWKQLARDRGVINW